MADPTYEQVVTAWQETLDQQDEWRREMREMSAEIERLIRERDDLAAKVADYEHRINWDTICKQCASYLDAAYAQKCRAELAEATIERVQAVHQPTTPDAYGLYGCSGCDDGETWPCPTIRALDGTETAYAAIGADAARAALERVEAYIRDRACEHRTCPLVRVDRSLRGTPDAAEARRRRRAHATGGGPCPTCGRPCWTHVCLSCSPDAQTPGPGCGDCGDTGMDQTPCRPAPSPSFGDLAAAQGVTGRVDPASLAVPMTEEKRAAVLAEVDPGAVAREQIVQIAQALAQAVLDAPTAVVRDLLGVVQPSAAGDGADDEGETSDGDPAWRAGQREEQR